MRSLSSIQAWMMGYGNRRALMEFLVCPSFKPIYKALGTVGGLVLVFLCSFSLLLAFRPLSYTICVLGCNICKHFLIFYPIYLSNKNIITSKRCLVFNM